MDASNKKKDGETKDRQEEASLTAEVNTLTATVKPKSNIPKDELIKKNKKAKLYLSKKKDKPKAKKTKEIVLSSSDDSSSSVELSSSDLSDSSESSDSSDDTEIETKKTKGKEKYRSKMSSRDKKKSRKRKSKHEKTQDEDSESNSLAEKKSCTKLTGNDDLMTELNELQKEFLKLQIQNQRHRLQNLAQTSGSWNIDSNLALPSTDTLQLATLFCNPSTAEKKIKTKDKKKKAFGSKLDYKKIDRWWDNESHRYKTTDTDQNDDHSKYDQYLFNVRREFDYNGKYKLTTLDIKSKVLKEELSKIMEEAKYISFAQNVPTVCPNLSFLYLEEIRRRYKQLKHVKIESHKKRKKALKLIELKRKHLKVLLNYIDTDYANIKKTLFPMLESGLITFNLLWGLYKPGSIVCCPTHGCRDELRAFKIEFVEKLESVKIGEYYRIEGKYLEYDGKIWGMGKTGATVLAFNGARKITSLDCYPLEFHEKSEKLRSDLIERGKKFVNLQGVHYKTHEGMAFYQKKKDVLKVNINSRIMIDPALHRRFFPNYPVSSVLPNYSSNYPNQFGSDSEDNSKGYCGSCDDDSDDNSDELTPSQLEGGSKFLVQTSDGLDILVTDDMAQVEKHLEESNKTVKKEIETVCPEGENEIPVFTDEEYLIASPIVLGFSFVEKLWLEFTVSGVKEILWNDGAYDSLVLEENTKNIVKALVESHKNHPAKNIDDVIRGKGKGLVAVLHGPPGTGKTLTAEGIAELLKYPLYMVSAGELGHDLRNLERQLQSILDMANAWGAVLLLDEADVFLEKRNIADIHRNALVSTFLRLLEYFQGILFLTTNRVETFDEAFQSRIHVALRYEELGVKARKSVFKIFLQRAADLDNVEVTPFSDDELIALSKYKLNGRQIKNTIRTALALAVQEHESLNMSHVEKVLDMSRAFDRDLKGGPGFEDAMRGYF